jgi:catechol 2,3-dioxygenase-like lactoylglutathione lyase family enzyme
MCITIHAAVAILPRGTQSGASGPRIVGLLSGACGANAECSKSYCQPLSNFDDEKRYTTSMRRRGCSTDTWQHSKNEREAYMHVKGLAWLGLRTTQFEEMVTFLRDVMGMQPVRDEPEIAGFQMTDGTQVELYRPEEEFHAFFTTGPVVAFWVDDVDAARTTMEAAGIEFIGPIQRAGKTSWNHFRAPDGTVFEVSSKSDADE